MKHPILPLITSLVAASSLSALPGTEITNCVAQAFRTDIAPVIDGNIDDVWDAATAYDINTFIQTGGNAFSPPANAADLSGTFKALWDAEKLYLLLEVMDDTIKETNLNSFEFYISTNYTRLPGQWANPGYNGISDLQIIVPLDTKLPIHGLYSLDLASNGSRVAGMNVSVVMTDSGYRAEISLTWATLMADSATTGVSWDPDLGVFTGGDGDFADQERDYIGFDIHLQDDDDGAPRDTKVAFCGGPATIKSDMAWADTSFWGTLQLVAGSTPPPPCHFDIFSDTEWAILGGDWVWSITAEKFYWTGFCPFVYDYAADDWYYFFTPAEMSSFAYNISDEKFYFVFDGYILPL